MTLCGERSHRRHVGTASGITAISRRIDDRRTIPCPVATASPKKEKARHGTSGEILPLDDRVALLADDFLPLVPQETSRAIIPIHHPPLAVGGKGGRIGTFQVLADHRPITP